MLANYDAVGEGGLTQPPGTRPRIWSPTDMVVGLVAITAGGVLVIVLFSALLGALDSPEGRGERVMMALAAILLEGTLGLWVAFRRQARGLSWAQLGFVAPRRWGPLWVAWAGSYLILLGYSALLSLLESLGVDTSRFSGGNTVPIDPTEGGLVLLLLAIAVVGLAPLCEELFFRALIFRGLRGFWTLTPSLLASGLLFGLFHFNLGVVLPFTLIGVVFAWSNEESGSIYTSIAAHGAVNALSFVLTAAGLGA
jgi:membrane protease YdiL (CAAX protease family)